MKKIIAVLALFTTFLTHSQSHQAYQGGEWFQFRIHYLGFNASFATLEVAEETLKGKPVYHIKGQGKSTGLLHWFFKVDDNYETYVDRNSGAPYRFIRQIDEGGHTKDIQIDFNHATKKATVNDKKKNKTNVFSFPKETQDMISAFYYLRNKLDTENLKEGDVLEMNMFFDNENYKFRLKFLGKEILDTNFGRVRTLIFRPYVQSGRVFIEKESLTVWISDDSNKMPMLVKADLAVGSLKATLTEFKGLQHSFKILADQ